MEQRNKLQSERLDFLLDALKEDSIQYKNLQVGNSETEKRNAVRSLMNVRMPRSISDDFLEVQDIFLQEEAKEKGIVTLAEIPTVKDAYESQRSFADRMSIWQGDITRLQVGAIVNAANSQMIGCFVPCHRCIDNAIHSAAGVQLRNECNHIMNQRRIRFGRQYEEPTGTATLTSAYNLPCKYVIHTVGPIVYGRLTEALKEDLRNCYRNVLQCCMEHEINSVAFCCISTGEFHFPNDIAAQIAVETTEQFFAQNENCGIERVIFNVFKDIESVLYLRHLSPMDLLLRQVSVHLPCL